MKNTEPTRLVFIEKINKTHSLYKCSCGNIKPIRFYFANSGKIKSCGCLQKEIASSKKINKNIRKHPLYSIWWAMKYRCYNIKNISYKNYGAKGVRVCDEWRNDFVSFYNWCISNGWRKGLQIDKDKVAKKLGIPALLYSPEMCSILTVYDNNNIKHGTNPAISYNGKSMTLCEWANELKISKSTLYNRIYVYGYSIEKAFTKNIGANLYEYNGELFTIKELSIKFNVHKNTIRYRVNNNLKAI